MNITNKNNYFNNISEFEFVPNKKVGQGSFGEVRLAMHLPTSKIYALKIADCHTISEPGRRIIERESRLNQIIDHPHIVKLWQVLKQDSKIYMVMEYAEKGNLFCYQNEKRVFTEQEAVVFFSQTLSALEYLHSLKLIHRDIKPQNILLDRDLNVKLCDFGWATEFSNQLNTTFCGTYEYMAPEMIFQTAYDQKVDIWAMGVLLYELLHGFAPFSGTQATQVRKSMERGEIHIDSDLSLNAQNLILSILRVNPCERPTISQLKCHPWLIEHRRRKINRRLDFDSNHSSLKKLISIFEQKSNSHKNTIKGKSPIDNSQAFKKQIEVKRQKKLDKNYNLSNITSSQILKRPPSAISNKNNNKKTPKNILKGSKQKIKYFGAHKHQKSSICELYKNSRLKTELLDSKTMKFEHNRMNTEIGQISQPNDQRSTIKKKNTGQRKAQQFTQQFKNSQKLSNHCRSID